MTHRTISLAVATAVAGVGLALPATTAFAATGHPCDAYSKHCPQVEGHKIVRPPTEVQAEHATLPFTGAEIVLMTLAGGAAVGAGTALVVAGRRRRTATPA